MPPFPSWRFREMDRGELAVDPVHDEFFKAQDLADALVRESIQNSLDARRGHSTVRVRFRFGLGTSALAPEAAAPYLMNLHEHLEATHVPLPHPDEPMPFLLIEDFGTRGLTGDPSIDPELESEESERNDFYYFWRNVGRSSKGELDRGRWGLGKAVFSVASRIRTVFGMTLRPGESHPLLLGQSVLKVQRARLSSESHARHDPCSAGILPAFRPPSKGRRDACPARGAGRALRVPTRSPGGRGLRGEGPAPEVES